MSQLGVIAIILGVAGLFVAARLAIYLFAQKVAMLTKPGAPGTPAEAGLPYEELEIRSGSRRLRAWWVKAVRSQGTAKAILIYHGNNETMTEWIPVLGFLWKNGISSFIFDYSGFGYSSGRATFRSLRQDAVAARTLFEEKAAGAAKYLLGLSLGSAVVLEGQAALTTGVSGIILVGAFSSIREIALSWKIVPAPLAYLAPNNYNNAELIRTVHVPVLIVHSREDELFPPKMVEELLANANEPKSLILLDGLKHNGMLEGRHADYLAPVIEFVQAATGDRAQGGFQRNAAESRADDETMRNNAGGDR